MVHPPEFEAVIQRAVDEKIIAGCSLAGVYKTKDGSTVSYLKAFGSESVAQDSPAMKVDSLLWAASCTKLLATISALQLVEKGIVTLDGPLDEFLPEFTAPVPLLVPSTDTTAPPTVSSTNTAPTLRHLLSHSAGFAYEYPDTVVAAWRASLPESSPYHASKVSRVTDGKWDIASQFTTPLSFIPGTLGKWQYSPSLEWAGKIVERANPDHLTLGFYMEKHIWDPLAMTSTTFRPLSDPLLSSRLIQRTQRLSDGSLALDPMKIFPHSEPVDESGGGGMYTTARDYIRVLNSLLLDDGVLLQPSTVAEMFRPQIPSTPELQTVLGRGENATGLVGGTKVGVSSDMTWNFGLGGLLAMEAVDGKGGKGMLLWSGLPNCFWWIDREGGTAGFYGSQLFPDGDMESKRLHGEFHKWCYKMASGSGTNE